MRVVVLNSRYANGTSKKGNPYNGFFADIAYPENGTSGYKARNVFLDVKVMQGVVPEPGMVLDIDTGFGTTFINSAVPVTDDPSFLTAFFAPFQKAIAQLNGK